MSNSTLHNTAGRTQAVNISMVQRMVGGRKGDGEQKKEKGSADESSKIAARRVLEAWGGAARCCEAKNGEQPADRRSPIPRKNVKSFNCDVTFLLEVRMNKTPLSRRVNQTAWRSSLSTISRAIKR